MLRELQAAFLASITASSKQSILPYIQAHPLNSPARQFAVYRDSIVGRLHKALKAIYPVCQQLVGAEFFLAMASEYIAGTPSRSPDLNDYGQGFASFIENFPPAECLPYLSDTARLEWAWHHITSAPDCTRFDFVGLAACYEVNAEQIIFTLPERASLLASPYPVHQIWETNQPNYQGDNLITLPADKQYYFIIWRDQFELRIDQLNEREWFILGLLAQQQPLASVCEQTIQAFPEVDVAALLATWVNSGWIAGFTKTITSL